MDHTWYVAMVWMGQASLQTPFLHEEGHEEGS